MSHLQGIKQCKADGIPADVGASANGCGGTISSGVCARARTSRAAGAGIQAFDCNDGRTASRRGMQYASDPRPLVAVIPKCAIDATSLPSEPFSNFLATVGIIVDIHSSPPGHYKFAFRHTSVVGARSIYSLLNHQGAVKAKGASVDETIR